MTELGWFGRPTLTPLGIDLAEFNAAGLYYSKGVTAAGRIIWAKYRMGWLKVWLEDPDEALLSAQIAPLFDYGMAAEQVCDLTGMTVGGQRPVVTPEAVYRAEVKDWSGATIHLSQFIGLTAEGETLLRAAVDDLSKTWDVRMSLTRFREPPIDLPSGIEAAPTANGFIGATIPTEDVEGRKAVDRRLGSLLFREWDIIDLGTGQRLDRSIGSGFGPAYSIDLVDWCAAAPHRYFHVHQRRDPPILRGLRPIDATARASE